MAKPIWGTGNAQAITGTGKVTSVQVTTGGTAQLFDSATGANGITMTTLLGPAGGGSHPFPNGLDFKNGVYVAASGAWVVAVGGPEYIGG